MLQAVAEAGAQPAIARATALAELAPFMTPTQLPSVQRGLGDPDPLVRIGALDALTEVAPEERWRLAATLLKDPVLAVRLRAVALLLPGAAQASADQRATLDQAAAEYLAVERGNADRADARTNIGLVAQQRGDAAGAELEYRAALKLDPSYTPARVNLADLYRAGGRDADGEALLRQGIANAPSNAPSNAPLHHALGLLYVRGQHLPQALSELRLATQAAPASARYAYVYAIALNSSGQKSQALEVLRANERRHPADRDTLLALVDLMRESGDQPAALRYAQNLAELMPADPSVAQMIQVLRAGQ